MPSRTYLRVLGTLVIAGAVLASVVPWAQAATNYTWNGTSARREWDFKLGSAYKNWLPTTPLPGTDPADTVTFDKIGATNLGQVWLNGDRTVAKVTFGNTTGTYTIMDKAGAPAATLTTAAIEQTAAATGTTANEIAAKLSGNGGLGDELALTVSGGSLKLSGLIGTDVKPVTLSGNVASGATLEVLRSPTGPTAPNYLAGAITVAGTLKTTGNLLGGAQVVLNGGTLTLEGARLNLTPGIRHRWSFGETGGAGTVLVDSVGGAHGTIVNVGALDATVGSGQATLAGGDKNQADYVDLPDRLVSGLTDLTVETWATQFSARNWSRVFDFGADTNNNFLMSWSQGTDINYDTFAFKVGGVEQRAVENRMAPYTLGQEFHITMTLDADGGAGGRTLIKLYKDGVLRGTGETDYKLSQLNDINNWIGRSQYGDETANASYNEFRLYDRALTDAEVAASYGLGPNPQIGNGDALYNLTVMGHSTLDALGILRMGHLELSGNGVLTVTDPDEPSVTFTSATFNGPAGGLDVAAGVPLRIGVMTDGGTEVTVTKSGAGDLILDQTDLASMNYATTFRLDGGRIVAIGKAGAQDPLGGASLALNGGESLVLSSTGGNWTVTGNVAATADSLMELKKESLACVSNAVLSITGSLDIDPGVTLTVNAQDGYSLILKGATTDTGNLALEAGRITVDATGSVATASQITVAAGMRLSINGAGGLGAGNAIDVGQGAQLDLAAAQGTFPQAASGGRIDAAPGAVLFGDFTGADYNPAGGARNMFLSPDVVLALTAGPEPTRANMGGTCVLWRGVTNLAGTYTGLGDDGVASVYKGVVFSSDWTPAGDFVGILGDAAGPGFEVGLRRDQRFGKSGTTKATFRASPGASVLITGDTKMTIGAALLGVANTFVRRGTAPSPGNRGTLGKETFEFDGYADLLSGSRKMTVENGGVFLDQDTSMRKAVSNTATLEIGPYATLTLNSNIHTGKWVIKENGYVWSNAAGRLVAEKDPGASITFANGSYFMYNYSEFKHVANGLPLDKRLNIIANADFLGYLADNQIRLADGALLTTPYNRSHALYDHSGNRGGTGPSPSGGIFLTDPNGTAGGPTVLAVRLGKANGGDLALETKLDLRNNLVNGSASRAHLFIGAAPGTEPWLPADDPTGDGSTASRDWANWAQMPMSGAVVLRSGPISPNYGRGQIIAGDVTVESGIFRLGDNTTGRDDVTLDINGEILVENGGYFYVAQRPAAPLAQLYAGTLGLRHILENGGRMDYQTVNSTETFLDIEEPVVFRGGGTTNVSHFVVDHDETLSGRDANASRGYNLRHVRIEEGADVAVTLPNIERHNMRWDLTVAGNGRIQKQWGGGGGPAFSSIAVEGAVRRALALGAGGTEWLETSLYGAIGDYVTLDLQLATLYIEPGATLAGPEAPGGGTLINSWGNRGLNEDSWIQVYAGASGTGFSGGTFNFSGDQDLILRANDVATGTPRIVNNMTSRINILTDNGGVYRGEDPNLTGRGTIVHGWLQTGRGSGSDLAVSGVGYFRDIHLGNAATLELESRDGTIWKGDLTLDGPTGGLFNWNNDNENEVAGISGNPALPGNEQLTVYGASRTHLTGRIEGVDILWNNTNCMHIENSTTGPETFSMAPDVKITTVNPWMWADILADPGAGTFENLLGWPKYGTPFNENLGNWWQEEGRGRYYLYYGGSVGDTAGDVGWGEDVTFNLGGGSLVSLRVEVPAVGTPNNVNKLDAAIHIVDNNSSPDGDWVKDLDGRLLAQWEYNQRNNAWGAWSHFANVHLHEGAQVRVNTDAVTALVDLIMEGNGKVHIDTNQGVIGTVNGNPGLAGNETLGVLGLTWTRYNGLIGGQSPVNVVAAGNPDGVQDWIELRRGFNVAPGSRWTRGKGDMRIVVYENLTSPSGGGAIDLTGQVIRTDWWYDEGSIRFEYGMLNSDLNGDNGHGAGLVFETGGQTRFRLDVDDNATPGAFNLNRLDSRINVVNNVANNYDAFLHVERRADVTGVWASGRFSDVHIAQEGAEVCLNTAGGAWIQADVTLDGVNGRLSNWDTPDREIVTVTSAAENTLAIDTHARDAGWWSTPHLDLTLNGLANAALDSTGGGAFRVMGLHLNGRTLTIQRTSGQGYMAEMWPQCNTDPGEGLIDILGWDNGMGGFEGQGLQLRMVDYGGIAIQAPTRVQIHNNQALGGFVRERMVQAVQEVQAPVKVMPSVTDTDAILRTIKSGEADEGDTPGMFKIDTVVMGAGSKAELQAYDNTRLWLPSITLEGDAEVWQNTTQNRIFLGDVAGTGALTVGGNGWTRLVGHVATAVNVTGWAVVDETCNLAGTTNVNPGGVLIVNKAMAGDGLNVSGGGVLAVANAGFTPGTMTLADGGAVALAADVAWTDTANALGQSGILIAKEGYASQITLHRNDTAIGAEWTDRAGILTPLAGTATTVNLTAPGTLLTIGGGVLTDFSGNPTDVNIARDVRLAGNGTYSGVTSITGGRTVVMGATSLGGAAGGGTNVLAGATLDVLVNLTESSVNVTGGTVRLHGNLTGNVTLGGGTLAAEDADYVWVAGDVTDVADTTIQAPAGKNLWFEGGPALTADRQWTVPSGTVAFLSGIGTDGGGGGAGGRWNFTKLGPGMLRLESASGVDTLTVGGGIDNPGGTVIINSDEAPLPTRVVIRDEAAYGVSADHGYAEVDMLNSYGCIVIESLTTQDLTMQNERLSLGASSDAVYSGTLTPYDDGFSPVYYQLGGGGATLTVQSALVEGASETGVRIGREVPGVDDITHQGMVILDAANTFMGYLDIYGYAGITSGPAGDELNRLGLGGMERPVRVFTGGSLDLGGVAVPEFHNISLWEGGGVSSNDYILTATDIERLFAGAAEIVIGGGLARSGVTTVEDGAMAGPIDFRKIGPNEVVLADPGGMSGNHDVGNVTVEAGTLTITELTSLGLASFLTVQGSGTMNFAGTGSIDELAGEVRVDGAATLRIADGLTVRTTNLKALSDAARVTLTGGGTLDVGDTTVVAPADNGAQIEIAGGSTLIARYGSVNNQRANLFRVREGSTLNFATADFVNQGGVHVQNQSIGWMYPGATLELGPDQDLARGEWQTCFGNPGLTFDADPLTYNEGDPLAPYAIRVGANTRLAFWNGSGTSSLRSAAFADASGLTHRPVAYVRKEGLGTMEVYGWTGFDAGDTNAARIFHWTAAGGTLRAAEEGGLGADAYHWVFNDKRATIANQHLEGITVEDGGTLEWTGTHGFLAPGAYGGMPAEQGNGFVAGDFVLKNGSTLRGNNLKLGFYQTYTSPGTGAQVTDTYLCYPTIEAPGATDVTFGGTIRFDSGIAVNGGGPVHVTVTDGDVTFGSSLTGAVGANVIRTLTQEDGTTRFTGSQTLLESTDLRRGAIEFDPGAGHAITYAGALSSYGTIRAQSGATTLSGMVTSPAAAPGPLPAPTNGLVAHWSFDDPTGSRTAEDETGTYNGALIGNARFTPSGQVGGAISLDGNGSYVDLPDGFADFTGGITVSAWVKTAAYTNWGRVIDFGNGAATDCIVLARRDTSNNLRWEFWSTAGGTMTHDVDGVFARDEWQHLAATVTAGHVSTIYLNGTPISTLPNFQLPPNITRVNNFIGESNWGWDDFLNGMMDELYVYNRALTEAEIHRTMDWTPHPPRIVVADGAKLTVAGFSNQGRVQIAGTLEVGSATSSTYDLEISGLGTLDLTTGNLVVDYSPAAGTPYDTVAAWVEAGLNAGGNPWTGSGITSSTAAEDPDGVLGVGIIDNTDPDVGGFTVFEGAAVDASSILVKSTYWGDANLDGVVDANDYDQIDKYFLFPPAKYTWATGDFNFDGIIDANDYDKIDRSFLFQGDPLGGGSVGGGGAVPVTTPEPATLALLGLGALAALAGRRRSR